MKKGTKKMKLVIYTHVRENYAAHNGFTGEYHWKNKGGNIYVVEDITPHIISLAHGKQGYSSSDDLRNIFDYITEDNDSFQESIHCCEVMDDDDVVGDSWEIPYIIESGYLGSQGANFRRTILNNDEYGYMRREIAQKEESWVQMKNGDRRDYKAVYTMTNGDIVEGEDGLCAYLRKEYA